MKVLAITDGAFCLPENDSTNFNLKPKLNNMEKDNLKNGTSGSRKPLLAAVFMLLIWGIFTLLLAISIFGLMVLVIMAEESDNGKGWFNIPVKCVEALT